MTTCALPGCALPARTERVNSCCCDKHRRKHYKQTHREETRAYEREHNKVAPTEFRLCACGCGQSFQCTLGSRRVYIDKAHGSRDRSRRESDKALRHERYKARYVPAPRDSKPDVSNNTVSRIACKVDKPAPAQTHSRMKPKSHNATKLDERMDKVVRDAWLAGDKYQREQIEALNVEMKFHE